MKITQSWFYDISQNVDPILEIAGNLEVWLYDEWIWTNSFLIDSHSNVVYYGLFFGEHLFKKHILLHSEWGQIKVNILTYAQKTLLKADIAGELSASKTKANVGIISLVWDGWNVDIDGKIQVDERIEKVEGNLHQENIYLSETGSVKWVPTLLVRSNDVKASHGCNTERINDEKLFYLRSRWISKEESIQLMIGGYFERIFWSLRDKEDEFVNKLFEKFQAQI